MKILLFSVALLTTSATAQIPDSFENLKRLPKSISKPELVETMRGFSMALGVRCNHCHPGPDNLQGMDFASDEKPAKQTARVMMAMLDSINEEHLAERSASISCATCHRGVTEPISIVAWFTRRVDGEGLTEAIRGYRELRDRYFGTAAYDFSAGPLATLTQRSMADGKLEQALAIAELTIEFHGEEANAHALLGSVRRAAGDFAAARDSLLEAQRLAPNNPWVAQLLAEVTREMEAALD